MEVYRQRKYNARFEWGPEGVRALAPVSDVIVILDVLSFTTCVDVVVGRQGVVFPYLYKDGTAAEYALRKKALLAGNRGEPLSLSPSSLAAIQERTRIVLPSPNGATCSFIANDHACTVIAACLRNAAAVARFVRDTGGVVSVIASGERWPDGSLRPCFEDLAAAGALLSQLEGYRLSPEAQYAAAAYESSQRRLRQMLMESSSGQELIANGYSEDVEIAAQLNASQVIPILNDEAAYVAANARH
ncbi:phosphosulfolactate phosphohydrolase [Paenibacillus rhizovicinus]|uniref:Probable 2-phosphosulfolactate phosphatase n=2 Tax=Paenibacillus rhizovicinus TaxID=2704463 RepID=A0A6C0P9V5_9BACL|nr:phosphosulfolactate phosphohydrolase [Paenibacillus rhizovicinus]